MFPDGGQTGEEGRVITSQSTEMGRGRDKKFFMNKKKGTGSSHRPELGKKGI